MERTGDPQESTIIKVKEARVEIQKVIDKVSKELYKTDETKRAVQRLKEARHWLGEELNRLGTTTPYPHADNTSNAIISPRADV